MQILTNKTIKVAVAEVILIMIGVLAALGLQSWWEDRVEQSNLNDYLIALEEEVRFNNSVFDYHLRGVMGVLGRTEAFMQELAALGDEDVPASLYEKLRYIYMLEPLEYSASAYEDMVNSGNFRLIADRDLRNKIKSYYARALSVEDFQQRVVSDDVYRGQQPFHVEYGDTRAIGNEREKIDDLPEFKPLSIPESPHSIDSEMMKSRKFWNLLHIWRSNYEDYLSGMSMAKTAGLELGEILESEIAQE